MTDTDKENGKDVESAPWWVGLMEELKQFPGNVVRVLRGDGQAPEDRVPIWSVHPTVQAWYFWAFMIQTSLIVGTEVWRIVCGPIWHLAGWGTVLTAYKGAWDAISNQLLSAAITSLTVTEIGGAAAMIASRLYENLQNVRNQRREEGREEERARFEAERASQAVASAEWLKRRDEAQQKGEPFDEAPPWEANGASES